MTDEEIKMAESLEKCTFGLAHKNKSFAQHMAHIARSNPAFPLSERQSTTLRLMAYRYRRQIEDAGIIPSQEEAAKLKETMKAWR